MKAVVMISVVDMEPEIPGNEDVITSVHLVAEGTDAPSIAANAVKKIEPILARMTNDAGAPLIIEGHLYHKVVNILAALPEKGGIVLPSAAATQTILKRGEIGGPRKAIAVH